MINIKGKLAESEEIKRQTEEFLKKGNKIEYPETQIKTLDQLKNPDRYKYQVNRAVHLDKKGVKNEK